MNKAYTCLKNVGFVVIHRKKGVVVSHTVPDADEPDYKQNMHSVLENTITQAFSRGMPRKDFFVLCSDVFDKLEAEKRGS